MLDQRYLPRWIVVLIDAFLAIISLGLVYFILLGSPLNFFEVLSLPMQGAIILGVNVVFFFVYKTYSGIIRHSTFTDVLKLAFSSFTTAASIAIFNYTYVAVFGEKIFWSIILLLILHYVNGCHKMMWT